MWSEGRELRISLSVASALIFALCMAHEFGHLFVHAIIHGFGYATISLGFVDWTTGYHIMYDWARLWVTAGGLLFTVPFLALWKKVEVPSKIAIVVFILYGISEVIK